MLSDTDRSLRFELAFANGEHLAIQLEGSGKEPPAFWRLLASFQRLSALAAGWDSYGALPLSVGAVSRCITLLPALLPEGAPDPTVVPTRDGGVQFEWHRRGIDFEVTVPPAGPISYLMADGHTGDEVEWEGGFDLQAVHDAAQDAFARMARAS